MVTGLDLSVMRDIWPAMRGETGLWSCFSSAQTLRASRGGSCLPKPVTPITSSSFVPCVSCHRIFSEQRVSFFKWYGVSSSSLFRRWNHLRMMLLSFCHFISICIIYKIPFCWLPSQFFDSFYLSGCNNIGVSLMLTRACMQYIYIKIYIQSCLSEFCAKVMMSVIL